MDTRDLPPAEPTTPESDADFLIRLRTTLHSLTHEIDALPRGYWEEGGAEVTLAKRAMQQARHWLGEAQLLEGHVSPYPN